MTMSNKPSNKLKSTALILTNVSLAISIITAGVMLHNQYNQKDPTVFTVITHTMEDQIVQTPAMNAAATEEAPPVVTVKPAATKKVKKVVYLTFDDGPGKYTNEIVDILEQRGIHATFFMIGNQLKGNEQKVKDAFDAGNYIGLHSMTHNKKRLYQSGSSAVFIKEFKQEQHLIEEITGVAPHLVRAPYGSKPDIKGPFLDDIAAAGFKMWDWTIDSKDWRNPDKPSQILKEVKQQLQHDTEVILLHEKSQTVKILPELIQYLQNKGYVFAVYKPEQHFSVNFSKDDRL